MVTETSQPVEFFFTPDSVSNTRAYRADSYDLPGAWITGDKAYIDYDMEDALTEGGVGAAHAQRQLPAALACMDWVPANHGLYSGGNHWGPD